MLKILILAFPFFAFSPSDNTLEVHLSFSEIREAKGDLLLSVCRNENEFPYEPFRSIAIPKSAFLDGKDLHFSFVLPAGDYAIAVLDDENRNGMMDSNWLGLPQEGFAFSNNVKAGLTGPPSFAECRLNIAKSGFRHQITLNYW